MRNLQEQVKKAFCYHKFFWPFTVWLNCSSDLKNFANSRPSASNFKSISRSLEQSFLTVGQNNFGNKIPFPIISVVISWDNFFWKFGKVQYADVRNSVSCKCDFVKVLAIFWSCSPMYIYSNPDSTDVSRLSWKDFFFTVPAKPSHYILDSTFTVVIE